MARCALAAMWLLGVLASAAFAGAPGCTRSVVGTTPFFGGPTPKSTDKYVDQGPIWQSTGDISRLEIFYSDKAGCVYGVKPTYGPATSSSGSLMGLESGLYGLHLTLSAGEVFMQAEYKAGGKCLEYIKFFTSRGRILAIGNDRSSTLSRTVTVPRAGGRLASVRGWVGAAGGALQQLQLVWAVSDCPPGVSPSPAASPATAATSPAPKPASPKPSPNAAPKPASPKPTPTASPKPASPKPSPTASPKPASPKPSPNAAPKPAAAGADDDEATPPVVEETATAAPAPAEAVADAPTAPALAPAVPVAPAPAPAAAPSPAPSPLLSVVSSAIKEVCPPRVSACNTSADASAANYCPAVSPFTSNKCVGGCCVSSGKCKHGGCLANGLGKDVPMTCIGSNNIAGALALLGARCGYLACKLAVPGCKSTLLGGACVGTIVAVDASKVSAYASQYVGHPCVETTATGGVVALPKLSLGLKANEYVLAGWKACDCVDAGTLPKDGLLHFPSFASLFAMHRASPSPSPSPKPSPAALESGSAQSSGGDASLGAGSNLAAMRDLMLGSLSSSSKSDPFADFMTGDASSPSPDASASAAAPAADASTAAGVLSTSEPVVIDLSDATAAVYGGSDASGEAAGSGTTDDATAARRR